MLRPAEQPNPGSYVRIKERTRTASLSKAARSIFPKPPSPMKFWCCPPAPWDQKRKTTPWLLPFPPITKESNRLLPSTTFVRVNIIKRGFTPGYTDSYMIFENCFVPWERVFLAGEHRARRHSALCFSPCSTAIPIPAANRPSVTLFWERRPWRPKSITSIKSPMFGKNWRRSS